MGNLGVAWDAGVVAALAGVVVVLARAVELVVNRIVPPKQVLSDDEFVMLESIKNITTARDEDGVPLAWFPVYARRQNEEMLTLMRELVRLQRELVDAEKERAELLRTHSEEFRALKRAME